MTLDDLGPLSVEQLGDRELSRLRDLHRLMATEAEGLSVGERKFYADVASELTQVEQWRHAQWRQVLHAEFMAVVNDPPPEPRTVTDPG
jgi:hypothetical protein